MGTERTIAPPEVWDQIFVDHWQAGTELNPIGWWAARLTEFFDQYPLETVIDLGCGEGSDALALARRGCHLTGLDFSPIALARARQKAEQTSLNLSLVQADLSAALPLHTATFDGAMSNVALHAFPDQVTRSIFAEIKRILKRYGLFVFHVNSIADMPYRAKRYPRVKELELNFFLEAHGQRMRFFSEDYCRNLLSDWSLLSLKHLQLKLEDGEVFKCVWQIAAQKL